MDSQEYIHGYSNREAIRLSDQANTLAELLHYDSIFPDNGSILEAGCGVGSQTIYLANKNPTAKITSIDISEESIKQAQQKITLNQITNVSFKQANIFDLPFPDNSFDHIFVCFVLEHLHDPIAALSRLKQKLKPGGSITIIEGDHGSAYFYPESKDAYEAINCQTFLQKQRGGNSLIGRELFPLLSQAKFSSIHVSPRLVYVDGSKPELIEGFTKNTFIAMIEGVREEALKNKIIKAEIFEKGIKDLYRVAEKDGVFLYTFFKATAIK